MYCKVCGSYKHTEVHHLDGNHHNNSTGNRVRLCRRCHVFVHRHFGAATAEELINIADKVREQDPKRFPPTLFD